MRFTNCNVFRQLCLLLFTNGNFFSTNGKKRHKKTARGGEMTDTGEKLLYDLMFNLRFLLSLLSGFYHVIVSDNLGFVLLFEGFESIVFCGVGSFVDILNGSF